MKTHPCPPSAPHRFNPHSHILTSQFFFLFSSHAFIALAWLLDLDFNVVRLERMKRDYEMVAPLNIDLVVRKFVSLPIM